MHRPLSHRIPAALLLATLALAARPARAQTQGGRVALNQLEPTPTGDAFLAVPSPRIGGHLVPRASALFDYATRPLTMGEDRIPIVASQGFVRADFSLALADRFLLSVQLPFAIVQSGDNPNVQGIDAPSPRAPVLGDPRIGIRARVIGKDDRAPFQLGLGVNGFAPLAPPDAFVGEGDFRADVHALAGGRVNLRFPLLWSASAGAMLRASENPHTLRFGAGVALLLAEERFSLGVEIHGARSLGQTTLIDAQLTDIMAAPNVGLEVLGEGRLRLPRGFTLAAAAGPGLLSGLGTPAFRGIFFFGWASSTQSSSHALVPHEAPRDKDGDGLRDDVDACPNEKGILSGDPNKDGCPPPDRDGDGLLDFDDACPMVPGVKSDVERKNGCPSDRDDDGIPDSGDACPDEKGLVDGKKKGCPSDRDEDGVFDTLDACPDQKGIAATDPEQRGCPEDRDGDGIAFGEDRCPRDRGARDAPEKGCPRFIRQEGDEIVVSKRIETVPWRDTRRVAPEDTAELEEIRDLLRDWPEIRKLEIQGHTDDAGVPKKKLVRSQEDAEIVMRALIELGVPALKLTAKGYGHKKPIADNRIPAGRRANQRITFVVMERAK